MFTSLHLVIWPINESKAKENQALEYLGTLHKIIVFVGILIFGQKQR